MSPIHRMHTREETGLFAAHIFAYTSRTHAHVTVARMLRACAGELLCSCLEKFSSVHIRTHFLCVCTRSQSTSVHIWTYSLSVRTRTQSTSVHIRTYFLSVRTRTQSTSVQIRTYFLSVRTRANPTSVRTCTALTMQRICWATTDKTSNSIRLNSSKQAHAPDEANPLKNCVGERERGKGGGGEGG